MDRYAVLLVLTSLLGLKVDGRNWRNDFPKGQDYGERGIVFENDYVTWKHEKGENSKEVEHASRSYGRHWDPDRVWFPDFDEKYFFTGTSSTEQTPAFPRDINECISQCPTTSEYNPVCGTNRVTYYNSGRLECARMCGVDVRVLRNLPCSLVLLESTTTETIKNVDDEQRQCIQTCPTTPEYNPICGTNNVTYENRGRLECAKFCGVAVEVKRLSPCPTPVTAINEDLSNSDRQESTSGTSSLFTSSTKPSDKPNVTIPQEVLNEIFNIPTDNSDEFDIDVRQKQ